jgi:hypothetical protein
VAHRQKCLHTYMDGFRPISVSTSVIWVCFRSLRPGYLSVTSVFRASTGFWVVVWRRLGTLLCRSGIIDNVACKQRPGHLSEATVDIACIGFWMNLIFVIQLLPCWICDLPISLLFGGQSLKWLTVKSVCTHIWMGFGLSVCRLR